MMNYSSTDGKQLKVPDAVLLKSMALPIEYDNGVYIIRWDIRTIFPDNGTERNPLVTFASWRGKEYPGIERIKTWLKEYYNGKIPENINLKDYSYERIRVYNLRKTSGNAGEKRSGVCSSLDDKHRQPADRK
ncbi:hypothetical protein JCM10556A_42700 [Bacteroides acidifaciens]